MNRTWRNTLGLALLVTAAGLLGWGVGTYARPRVASGGQIAVDPSDAPLPRVGLEVPTKRLEMDPARGIESLRLYMKDYQFTENWFSRSIALWKETPTTCSPTPS